MKYFPANRLFSLRAWTVLWHSRHHTEWAEACRISVLWTSPSCFWAYEFAAVTAVRSIQPPRGREQWRTLMNTVMNFQAPYSTVNFLSGWATDSFWRTQLHGGFSPVGRVQTESTWCSHGPSCTRPGLWWVWSGWWNENWRLKPVPMSFHPPQIAHDLTWDQGRAAYVGSRQLTNYLKLGCGMVPHALICVFYYVSFPDLGGW
jgi:hypothetical protein